MSNFNLDNAGAGFDLEDGDDSLEAMMSEAGSGVEDVGEGDVSALFGDTPVAEPSAEDAPTADTFEVPVAEEAPREAAPSPVEEPWTPTPEPSVEDEIAPVEPAPALTPAAPQETPTSFVPVPEEAFTPIPEPIPSFESPAVNSAPVPQETARQSKIHIPSLAEDLARVRQVIRVVDAYRALSQEERVVATQFVAAGGEIPEDESTFVQLVMNVDPMLAKTMNALREAKTLDDVERSFYIIELEDTVLYSLGSLVEVFMENPLDGTQGKRHFARSLVRAIDALDSKSMGFVAATDSVLAASAHQEV